MEAQLRDRMEQARWPDLGPSDVMAAMVRPPAALVGARKTLARLQEGGPVNKRAGRIDQPPDLAETARRLLNNPLASTSSSTDSGRPELDWRPTRTEESAGGLWSGRGKDHGPSTAKSDREPKKQSTEDDWWNDPDEEMIITADGYSSDNYHQWHDWGDEYYNRPHPYHGGAGGVYHSEDDEDKPYEEPDPSVALNGSDLSRLDQQECFVQRMGIIEENVDWLTWWTTHSDHWALYSRPGPDDTRWHAITHSGHSVIFALCSDTIVFARLVSLSSHSNWRYRAEWDVWAYRSPECTSEGLTNDWMLRNC